MMIPKPIIARVFCRKKYHVLRYWSSRGFALRFRRGVSDLELNASLTLFPCHSTTHGSLFMDSPGSVPGEIGTPCEIPSDRSGRGTWANVLWRGRR